MNNSSMPTYNDYFEAAAEHSTNHTKLSIQELSQEISNLGPSLIGTRELAGIMLLGIIIYALYNSKAGMDIWLTILPVTIFTLSSFGFLPYANTFIVLSILAIAGALSYGISQHF